MAFRDIDETAPSGTKLVSDLDDAVRETRSWAEDCFSQISGYPDKATTKVITWTTTTRPTTPNLLGYNSDTKTLEYINDSGEVKEPVTGINSNIQDLYNTKLDKSEVANAANKVPRFNASGHLAFPNGAEMWVG